MGSQYSLKLKTKGVGRGERKSENVWELAHHPTPNQTLVKSEAAAIKITAIDFTHKKPSARLRDSNGSPLEPSPDKQHYGFFLGQS